MRGISAEEVMVIHGVQTVIGGGETRTLDVWNTSYGTRTPLSGDWQRKWRS